MDGWAKEKVKHAKIAHRCEELEAEVEKLRGEAAEDEQRRRALVDNYNHLQLECNEVKECTDLKKVRDEMLREV